MLCDYMDLFWDLKKYQKTHPINSEKKQVYSTIVSLSLELSIVDLHSTFQKKIQENMAFSSLKEYVNLLEKENQLVRISTYVNPELEMTEIVDRVSKSPNQNKAILFENTGTDFPLLINSMGNQRRIELALGVDSLDDIASDIQDIFSQITSPKQTLMDKLSVLPSLGRLASYMPRILRGKGKCQEVVMTEPSLDALPILKCWPLDGGRFVTLPAIHTMDPQTGVRNIGMYRMQVFDPTMTGMHWHKHKVSARHFEEYKKLGKRMPIAVALGGDPVYTYAATAPLPDQVDEYILAGYLRKRKVNLVNCLTQPDIQVPADTDIIIEGYIEPDEELIWEGPFGDHTGFYSLPDWYPRFHVTAITHRRDAIYPATIVGIPPQEDAWIGKATEKIFLTPIKLTAIPEILDMHMPIEGVFHNLVLVKIEKSYPGQALKVMNAMWGAGQMMFNKMLVVIDADIDLEDYEAVAEVLFRNMDPSTDIHFSVGPMDVLDHSCSALGYGGKVCFDGTEKLPEENPLDDPMQYWDMRPMEDFVKVAQKIDGVRQINSMLCDQGLPCLIIGVEKTRKGQVAEIHQELAAWGEKPVVKLILYIDETQNINSISDALWYLCNNADPQRDKHLQRRCLGMDGTRKTRDLDDFHRDWPNIIASEPSTIEHIDGIWDSLGLGDFIPSPSLRYLSDIRGGDAEAALNTQPKPQ